MALPLILRNSLKVQANSRLLPNLVKYTPLTANQEVRNFSVTPAKHSVDHGKIWAAERALSVALVGLVPAAIAIPNPALDNLLAVASVIHFHWGLEACVIDYVRPIIFGNVIPKISLGLLYLVSAATLGGLLYYNTHDVGIGKTIKKIWAVKGGEVKQSKEEEPPAPPQEEE